MSATILYGSISRRTESARGRGDNEVDENMSASILPLSVRVATILAGLWRPIEPVIDHVDGDTHNTGERNETAHGINTHPSDLTRLLQSGGGDVTDDEQHGFTESVSTDFISDAEVWRLRLSKRPRQKNDRLPTCSSRAVDIIFFVVLLLISAWFLSDITQYLRSSWGMDKYILDTISYLCFTSQTFLVFIHAFRHRFSFRRHRHGRHPRSHPPFSVEFIHQRVALLLADGAVDAVLSRGHFFWFMFLPLVNTAYKVIVDVIYLQNISCTCKCALQRFNNMMSSLWFVSYGCFWYLVFVTRVSLHRQLNQTVREIRGLAKSNEVDKARWLITDVYSDFHVARKAVSNWMAVTLTTVTIHVPCVIMFNFARKSQVHLVTGMLWLQIAMFVVVPLAAVGAPNLEYLWRSFRHVITRSRTEGQLTFWEKVEKYIRDIDSLGQPVFHLTLVFPIVGVLFSHVIVTQTNDRRLEYWGLRYQCPNETNSSMTTEDLYLH